MALIFHWVSYLDLNRIEVNHLIPLVFGLMKSPFTLEGTLKVDIDNKKSVYPELIEKISNDMYLNNLNLEKNV